MSQDKPDHCPVTPTSLLTLCLLPSLRYFHSLLSTCYLSDMKQIICLIIYKYSGHSDWKLSFSSYCPLYYIFFIALSIFNLGLPSVQYLGNTRRVPEPWTGNAEALNNFSKSGGYFLQPYVPFMIFQLP